MFDTPASETLAQEAYEAILASRPVPVSDKAYSCQQVFSAISAVVFPYFRGETLSH